MEIIPIGERVLVKPIQMEERTKSGIYIPETAREQKKQGSVVSVGTREDGSPLPLKPGDHILYGGTVQKHSRSIERRTYLSRSRTSSHASSRGD